MCPSDSRNLTNPTRTQANGVAHAKAARRTQARAVRMKIHHHGQTAASAAQSVARNFIDQVPVSAGALVAGYWPHNSELDCLALLSALHLDGISLALPVITAPDAPLVFRAWQPGAPTVSGAHGIHHPQGQAVLVIPDVVIVPLLAFDPSGSRLGQGGGHYDRTLAQLRADGGSILACGVAYDAQLVHHLPRESFDEPLDLVVTESRVYFFDESVPERTPN